MGVLVGVASLQWVSLWEWLAFSGCIVGVASLQWVYCGSGQPSVGVLVGVASRQWVSWRREGEGGSWGKERDRRFQ